MPFPIRPFSLNASLTQDVTTPMPRVESHDYADLASRIKAVGNDVRRALATSHRRYRRRSDETHENDKMPARRHVPRREFPTVAPSPSPSSDNGVVQTKLNQTTFFRTYPNVSMVLKSLSKGATPFSSLVELKRDITYLWHGVDGDDDDFLAAHRVAEGADVATGLISNIFVMQMIFDVPRRLADSLDGKGVDVDQAFDDVLNIVPPRDRVKGNRLTVQIGQPDAPGKKRTGMLAGKSGHEGLSNHPAQREENPFDRDEHANKPLSNVSARCKRGLLCGMSRSAKRAPSLSTTRRERLLRRARIVTVPSDGVQVHRERPGDSRSNIIKVTARLDERDVEVRFDAELQRWVLEDGSSITRNQAGKWIVDAEDPLQHASVDSSASDGDTVSPTAISIDIPQMQKIPARLYNIPPQAYQIWIGETMPETLVNNVILNAQFLADRLAYDSTLYVDAVSEDVMKEMATLFADTPVKVKNLEESTFYQSFKLTPLHPFYRQATHSPNRNRAMASDIIRYALLYWHGGIYIDVDDRFVTDRAHSDAYSGPIRLAPGDLGFGRITRPDFLNRRPYFANTPLASHVSNPLLEEIADEMLRRLQTDSTFFDQPRPRTTDMRKPLSKDERRYIAKISHHTGLDLLTDVMVRKKPVWTRFATAEDAGTWRAVIGGDLGKMLRATEDYLMVFWRKIPVEFGNEHSWRRTRR